MSNSCVTLKVTQSYTFLFEFCFEIPKFSLKDIQKKLPEDPAFKTQYWHFFGASTGN